MFGFNYPPRCWAKCDGQYLQISQYQAVFALLATFYGGNGTNNFRLPDLQGRMPVGWGSSQSGGLQNVQMGQEAGSALTTIPAASLPTHTHTATLHPTGSGTTAAHEVAVDTGDAEVPTAGAYLAAGNAPSAPSAKIYKSSPGPKGTVALGGVTGGGSGGTITVDPAGGSQAFSTVSPYLALNFSIALMDGIFPARN